jgi:hypothetical protein
MNRTSSHNVFGLYSHRWTIFAATLCLTLVLIQPAQAEIFHCGGGNVACLIAAINLANANGHKNTIVLEAGAYTPTAIDNDTNGPNGLPSITSTLTIKGVAGANATGITRIFGSQPPFFRLMHVAATGNLTLEGVTLSGGIGFTQGGGLVNDGGTIHVVRSAITGNSAPSGGGLFNNAGTVSFEQTTVSHNNGSNGGGLSSVNGTLTTRESRFSQNGDNFFGGALALFGGTAFITTSTFDQNGSDGAGAISLCSPGCTSQNGGKLVVTDSAFTGNFSIAGGGAGIGIDSASTATITNTTFARNEGFTAPAGISNGGTLLLNSVTFAENTTTLPGGTLLSETGATTILENTILARTIFDSANPVPDCRGPVTSLGHNLIGDPTGCNINLQLSDLVGDPGLDTFQDNGKPGNGHFPLLPSSRAIDTGAVPCPRRDQIGQRRINECDTGAIAFDDGIDALP